MHSRRLEATLEPPSVRVDRMGLHRGICGTLHGAGQVAVGVAREFQFGRLPAEDVVVEKELKKEYKVRRVHQKPEGAVHEGDVACVATGVV